MLAIKERQAMSKQELQDQINALSARLAILEAAHHTLAAIKSEQAAQNTVIRTAAQKASAKKAGPANA